MWGKFLSFTGMGNEGSTETTSTASTLSSSSSSEIPFEVPRHQQQRIQEPSHGGPIQQQKPPPPSSAKPSVAQQQPQQQPQSHQKQLQDVHHHQPGQQRHSPHHGETNGNSHQPVQPQAQQHPQRTTAQPQPPPQQHPEHGHQQHPHAHPVGPAHIEQKQRAVPKPSSEPITGPPQQIHQSRQHEGQRTKQHQHPEQRTVQHQQHPQAQQVDQRAVHTQQSGQAHHVEPKPTQSQQKHVTPSTSAQRLEPHGPPSGASSRSVSPAPPSPNPQSSRPGSATSSQHAPFRRTSTGSTQSSLLAEPPELDLSHLSAEEQAQIAAVMARAQQMQVELDQEDRMREVEPPEPQSQRPPSAQPSAQPSTQPTAQSAAPLTAQPTTQPTAQPTTQPPTTQIQKAAQSKAPVAPQGAVPKLPASDRRAHSLEEGQKHAADDGRRQLSLEERRQMSVEERRQASLEGRRQGSSDSSMEGRRQMSQDSYSRQGSQDSHGRQSSQEVQRHGSQESFRNTPQEGHLRPQEPLRQKSLEEVRQQLSLEDPSQHYHQQMQPHQPVSQGHHVPQMHQAEQRRPVCPVCTSHTLTPDTQNVCVHCGQYVCLYCGAYERIQASDTNAQEWVCVICSECPPDEGQSQDTWYEDDQSQQLQGLDLHTGQPMKSTLEKPRFKGDLERAISLPDYDGGDKARYGYYGPGDEHDSEAPVEGTKRTRGVGQSALEEEEYEPVDSSDEYTSDMEEDMYGAHRSSRPQQLGVAERDEYGIDRNRTHDPSNGRTIAEGAENVVQTVKRGKPSPLDRVEVERPHSSASTRKSPKSPPRSPKSPSWSRYKESPPRSPTIKIASPTKSPTETFPSTYSDLSPTDRPDAETYASIFGYPEGDDNVQFYYPESGTSGPIPPPKPARSSEQYEFQDDYSDESNLSSHSLDIASFAAAIATDTEHLTNLSVSPTTPSHLDIGSDRDSISPPSPGYYDDVDDIDVSEPTPKNIDYQNSKRQKVRPPPTNDWSPVTDLSPILDVSPSVEQMEQEQMLAEQMGPHKSSTGDEEDVGMAAEGQRTVVRAPKRPPPPDLSAAAEQRRSLPSVQDPSGEQPAGKSSSGMPYPEIHVTKQQSEERQETSQQASEEERRKRRTLPLQPGAEADSKQQRQSGQKPTTILGQREAVIHRLQKEFREEYQTKDQEKEELEGRAPPHQLQLKKRPSQEREESKETTVNYNVLKSPLSPGKKVDRVYDDYSEEIETGLSSEEQAYLYPSPGTPPDHVISPPKPRSPSGPGDEEVVAAERMMLESMSQDSSSSAGSISEKKGSRRKLPPIPKGVEAVTVKTLRQRSFDAADEITSSSLTYGSTKGSSKTGPPVPPRRRSVKDMVGNFERAASFEEPSPRRDITEKPPLRTGSSPKKVLPKEPLPEKPLKPRTKPKPLPKPPVPTTCAPVVITSSSIQSYPSTSVPYSPPTTSVSTSYLPSTTTISSTYIPPLTSISTSYKPPVTIPPYRPTTYQSHVSTTAALTYSTVTTTLQSSTMPSIIKPLYMDMPKPEEETVSIFGIEVPVTVRAMKQRVKEEIQIVTATRRLHLDEMGEIRRMERELEERDRQRRLEAAQDALDRDIRLQAEAFQRQKDADDRLEQELDFEREREQILADGRRRAEEAALARMSPSTTRRARHKRQNSDPIAAKFSPIEERDLENELMQARFGVDIMNLTSDFYGTLSSRGPQPYQRRQITTPQPPAESFAPPTFVDESFLNRQLAIQNTLSKSSELLSQLPIHSRITSSRSETNLPVSDELYLYNNLAERVHKENKKHEIEMEIQKRRQQIEETARLQAELRQMANAAEVSRHEFEMMKERYDAHLQSREFLVRSTEVVPQGIIQPLDYAQSGNDIVYDMPDSGAHTLPRRPPTSAKERFFPRQSYSSTEYLVHREKTPVRELDPASLFQAVDIPINDNYPANMEGEQYVPGVRFDDNSGAVVHGDRVHGAPMVEDQSDYDAYLAARVAESGMSGLTATTSAGGGHIYGTPYYVTPPSPVETVTATPGSDVTPAMPLLEEVTKRSRTLLRDIGSRPISDDMDKYLALEDPLNMMYRGDSDASMGDSDENIMEHLMEGGVTIHRQLERKRQPAPAQPRTYPFPTKRILLNRDPKDRSIKGLFVVPGNGVSVKIVGGKYIPGTEGEIGAYVAAIQPGSTGDGLHGELQEGDQVIEWNGVQLTGKTYEDVQKIMASPNGEIELIIRPMGHGASQPSTHAIIRPAAPQPSVAPSGLPGHGIAGHEGRSTRSSYDNLDEASDADDYDCKCKPTCCGEICEKKERFMVSNQHQPHMQQQQLQQRGVDPGILAAQLQDIQERMSPSHPTSHTSSRQDLYYTPDMSSPALSEDVIQPVASMPSLAMVSAPPLLTNASSTTDSVPTTTTSNTTVGTESTTNEPPKVAAIKPQPQPVESDLGDIQLQLSFDDYDGTLNVHVLQAKNLQAKDKNGFSDPYVKVYLLPGKNNDTKRRTKYIPKTLDPEWHQTLVFMDIPRKSINTKTLEVTVWDYDRFKNNDFMGEVKLNLTDTAFLDNKPHWYRLSEHDEIPRVTDKPKEPPNNKQPKHHHGSSTSLNSKNKRNKHTHQTNNGKPRHHHKNHEDDGHHHHHHKPRSRAMSPPGSSSSSSLISPRDSSHHSNSSSKHHPHRSISNNSSSSSNSGSGQRRERRHHSSHEYNDDRPRRRSRSRSKSRSREPSPRAKHPMKLDPSAEVHTVKFSPGLGRRNSTDQNGTDSSYTTTYPETLPTTHSDFLENNVLSVLKIPPHLKNEFLCMDDINSNATQRKPKRSVPPLSIRDNELQSFCDSYDSFLSASPISPRSDSSMFSFDTQTSCTVGSDSSFGLLDNIWSGLSEETLTVDGCTSTKSSCPDKYFTLSSFGIGQVLPSQIGVDKVKDHHIITAKVDIGIQPDVDDNTLAVSVMSSEVLDNSLTSSTVTTQSPSTSRSNSPRSPYYKKDQTKTWLLTIRYMEGRHDLKAKRRTSRKYKSTTAPTFNEIFTFSLNNVAGVLEVILWTESRFLSQRKKIGTAFISLDKIDFEKYPNHELTSSYRLIHHS